MLSPDFIQYLKKELKPVDGVNDLFEIRNGGGLETQQSLSFLRDLYLKLREPLKKVLKQRQLDRDFFDQRTRACYEYNRKLGIDFLDPRYETVIGHEDGQGRTVIGPKNDFYCRKGYGKPIAPIPEYLNGNHVTLFGPPDDAKLSINAMNAYHRKIKDEPEVIAELLDRTKTSPKWGADDEDSKTPLRRDLIEAGINLTGCLEGTLTYQDPKSQKVYQLAKDHLIRPIKRFPGLALPCTFLFYQDEPMPLHLYDFALHFFRNWNNPEALAFYVPKLENEEEAAYVQLMMKTAEEMIHAAHPEYTVGSIRLMIVLENPRAIFRVNEIIDALHPYFVGASLGWHDYLASTARLFKEDPNYRIPVKADPHIVIQCIKASHDLLNEVVGSRGGIKVGGMYGILSIDNDLKSDSFQTTLKGFFKDIVTQLKRGLDGFWVAHPDFIRIGLAIVEAWKLHQSGQPAPLQKLVESLLLKPHHAEILEFIQAPDLVGLDPKCPLYPRALIVAHSKESNFIANHHPDEIRYNVFQSLQYLTDWLSGNGCVALPAIVNGVAVRVMDDLATAERSRWEVWHEIHHGRFALDEFLKIAHEEMLFIRKDRSNASKIVQVKWDDRTAKWYPIAMKLMVQLMTAKNPPEFATELLLPFTVESIREAQDPWSAVFAATPETFQVPAYIDRFNEAFSICGSLKFARALAQNLTIDLAQAESIVQSFDLQDILDAASFHGDIGESKKTLDEVASREQALVLNDTDASKAHLRDLGDQYLKKFGFKYLISAQGRTTDEILQDLTQRLTQRPDQERANARQALWEISLKRLKPSTQGGLIERIETIRARHKVPGAQISVSTDFDHLQSLSFGDVSNQTWLELASLSKTMASAFAVDYFKQRGVPLHTSVNSLLKEAGSTFKLASEDVQLTHLMNHQALNMHYVKGIPLDQPMPKAGDLILGSAKYGYDAVQVMHPPGSAFQYSGGGFLVLEHLIESLEKKSIQEITQPFFEKLNLKNLSFEPGNLPGIEYAHAQTRLKFPAFAAGAMGTALDYLKFLTSLAKAYRSPSGAGPISHDAAVLLFWSKDRSSQKFMGVNIGLGVFIAEAGSNRIAIHQGANDGFRCLSAYCFHGPDAGKGFVILCNADSNGVPFVAEVAQTLFTELNFQGIHTEQFKTHFDPSKIPQEEVVNRGYKDLVFSAFEPDLPEPIVDRGPPDPLAPYNLAVGAKITDITNQLFALAENLISTHLPIFDVELYGRQGKVMDSWESVRHNFKPAEDPCDTLVLHLKKPSRIRYVLLSTQYHFGNHSPVIQLEGQSAPNGPWTLIMPKTHIEGHSEVRAALPVNETLWQSVRVSMYPDGGFSRLGLFDETLPESEKKNFVPHAQAKSRLHAEEIPQPKKPLAPPYTPTPEEIKKNWAALKPGQEVDVACSAFGGTVVRATNEHYSPATQAISPYPPLNMFDGSESSRSRKKGHFEEVVFQLAKPSLVHRVEVKFTYFRNNNPHELSLEAFDGQTWSTLLPRTWVKPYAGNTLEYLLPNPLVILQVKVTVHPDGGFNRLHVWTRA